MINVFSGDAEKPTKLAIGTGSGSSFMTLDASQGALKSTGAALDLGISGNGLFTFLKKDAAAMGLTQEYTSRNGRMTLNNDYHIVNHDGDFLLDINNNKIQIPLKDGEKAMGSLNTRLTIRDDGTVYDEGKEIAKLKIQTDTNFVNLIPELRLVAPLQKVADKNANGFLADAEGNAIRVKQGFMEVSNVQIITEMIGLIHASKNYESGHKLITAEDKILDKAINELGRTG